MNELYLTGYSALTPLGLGLAGLDDVARQGRRRIEDFQPADYGWDGLGRFSRAGRFACAVVGEALKSGGGARVPAEGEDPGRTALIVGNSHSNLEAIARMQEEAELYGPSGVNPAKFPDTVLNMAGGLVSIYFKWRGTNTTISDGLLSGPKALLYAQTMLAQGRHDRVVLCNMHLFPPSHFRRKVSGHSPAYESVVALVLESAAGVARAKAKLSLCYGAPGTDTRLRHVPPEELLGQVLLESGSLSGVPLTAALGAEGSVRVTVESGGGQG